MEKKAHRPTLKTIAQQVGITANTVSLALRGSPLVADQTRMRVLEAAKQLGYVQDLQASSLRKGQSKIIALVFGDISNPLYTIKMKKLEDIFRKEGYQILIFNSEEADDPQREYEVMRTAISRKIDGMVCTPSQHGRESLDLLAQYGVPCVLVGRYLEDTREDCVVWDNVNGAEKATQFLLDHGCKCPIYVASTPDHISSERDRLAGFTSQMRLNGYTEQQIQQQCVFLRGESIEHALSQVEVPFDGVFAYRDQQAWEIATIVSPHIKIIGFDNVQSILKLPFSLPSIGADLDLEAQWVAELLLKRIKDPARPTEKRILPTFLVER